MRKGTIAFVWLLSLTGGVGCFAGLWAMRSGDAHKEFTDNYEKAWKAALGAPLKELAPDAKEELAKVPGWRRFALRREFKKLDEKHRNTYKTGLETKFDQQASDFRKKWRQAVEDFTDEPSIEAIVKDEKQVHEKHRDMLEKKLLPIDKHFRKTYPRTRLALDSFAGYSVFRSKAFRQRLRKQSIYLHLVDDKAQYKKRIKTLEDTKPNTGTPLAVFTLDALIINSATLESPPGVVVMLIDESRGADAILADRRALPGIGNLNRKEAKILFQPESPSDTLVRWARHKYLPDIPSDALESVDDDPEENKNAKTAQDKILERFKAALKEPTPKPTAYVLWQPYVSAALASDPNAIVLADSSHSKQPVIIDVLVAQKDYLNKGKGRDRVKKIVRAYLETLSEQRDMAALVRHDDPNLNEVTARDVAGGIRWKNAGSNFAHFGVKPDDQFERMEKIIDRIADLLVKTEAIGEEKKPDAKTFFDSTILASVEKFWKGGSGGGGVVRRDFEPVSGEKLDPIEFQTGSAKISSISVLDLDGAADKMKASPEYYLEVQGSAKGNTDKDRELARDRASTVIEELRQRGVAGERIFTAVNYHASDAKPIVSFLLLKKK